MKAGGTWTRKRRTWKKWLTRNSDGLRRAQRFLRGWHGRWSRAGDVNVSPWSVEVGFAAFVLSQGTDKAGRAAEPGGGTGGA